MTEAITIFYGFLLGAAVGSFFGAAFFRIKNRQSMRGRSQCPGCGAQIKIRDNIPILSFIVLRGRARCCDSKISSHYFLFEVAVATVFAGFSFLVGLLPLFLVSSVLIAATFLITEINKEQKNMSNRSDKTR